MLRFTLGYGWERASQRVRHDPTGEYGGDQSAVFSDAALHMAFDVGFSPIENLAFHARLSFTMIGNPHAYSEGRDLGTIEGAALYGYLVAPAITYYLKPLNVYVTLAPGLSAIELEDANSKGSTKGPGFGMNADIGKEWWVERNLVEIGAAARVWFSEIRESRNGADFAVDMFALSLNFSLTYR